MSQSSIARTVAVSAEALFLVLDPHGGQRVARRNALRALHAGGAAARGRRLAEAEVPAPRSSAADEQAVAAR